MVCDGDGRGESKFPAGCQHRRGLGGDPCGQARYPPGEPVDAKLDENDAKRKAEKLGRSERGCSNACYGAKS